MQLCTNKHIVSQCVFVSDIDVKYIVVLTEETETETRKVTVKMDANEKAFCSKIGERCRNDAFSGNKIIEARPVKSAVF